MISQDRLCLHLASSNLIKQWAQKKLPNGKKVHGQILHSRTVHYQTLKPEQDGLFCERIFGPIEDYKCACGKRPFRGQKFCSNCEVEYISSRSRRYRLGYIQLTTAVAHIWFVNGNYFSFFLNFSTQKIENLIYCTENIARTIFPRDLIDFDIEDKNLFTRKKKKIKRKKKNWYWKPQRVFYIYIPFRRYRGDNLKQNNFKKSLWQNGGVRDSALYFGFSVISKTFSWEVINDWIYFINFCINIPKTKDILNKFYPGPPGLVNFFGKSSRLFCLTGTQIMRTWLAQLACQNCNDGRLLERQIRLELFESKKQEEFFSKRTILFRRLKYLRTFYYLQNNPASMILSALPVLPPNLRPIIKLDEDRTAVSDLTRLYQNVLIRIERFSLLTYYNSLNCLNSEAIQYSQRLLQESVNMLIQNDKLKSLSDLFRGKKGRFRQNLLGKRVDYSGRSVIVVGPYLKIYECGLPKELAFELFQPLLIRSLMLKKKIQTISIAKKILKKRPFFIWELLNKIIRSHPILLNRAPTLHRLNIQAFKPRLIEGKAILLHPLVCSAFNADFDGDQMGVHVPLCFQARAEAWKLIWSQNNLFSVATTVPTCYPSQDMILGSSFLTSVHFQNEFLWIAYNPLLSFFDTEKKIQKPLEIRLTFKGYFQKIRSQFFQQYHSSGAEILRKMRTTYGRVKFNSL